MPPPSPYDSAGTGSDNIRKRRLFLNYVDLEKSDPLLRPNGQISLIRRGKRATVKSQDERQNQAKLESWEGLSVLDPNIPPSHREHQPASMSASSYGRRITLEPVRINVPSLPPSSPLASFSQEHDAVGPLEEDGFEEADPFGFLAAEKKLQDQKPLLPSVASLTESLLEEEGSFGEEDFSGEAFASQTASTVNKHEAWTVSVQKKQLATPLSPSVSFLTNPSNDPSSPCRKAVRHRSTKQRKMRGGVGKGKDEDTAEHSEYATFELDDVPPKSYKRNVQKNGCTRRKLHKVSKNTAIRQSRKIGSVHTTIPSHLTNEERNKFEKEREERLTYYRRVDAYHVAKEIVWVV